jgi:protein AFG1
VSRLGDRYVHTCNALVLPADACLTLADYRKLPRALSKVYFNPITPSNRLEIDKLFDSLAGSEPLVEHRPLTVWGRAINVPLSTSSVAKFDFLELCGKPLSAADYLEITKTFQTIFLTGVPQLGLDTKDQARRFILFIDAAYEAKVRYRLLSSLLRRFRFAEPALITFCLPPLVIPCKQTKLFILSDPPIGAVFSDQKSDRKPGEISDHQRAVMDELGLSADVVGASSIFTGDEEVFAFARAVVSWLNTSGACFRRMLMRCGFRTRRVESVRWEGLR